MNINKVLVSLAFTVMLMNSGAFAESELDNMATLSETAATADNPDNASQFAAEAFTNISVAKQMNENPVEVSIAPETDAEPLKLASAPKPLAKQIPVLQTSVDAMSTENSSVSISAQESVLKVGDFIDTAGNIISDLFHILLGEAL